MSRIYNWSQFSGIFPTKLSAVNENHDDDGEEEVDPKDPALSKKAKDKITWAKMQLVSKAPFFGQLASKLSFKERYNLPYKTMATDGLNIFYDPGFVMKHTSDEIKWVICHEIMHCVLNHFLRAYSSQEGM